MEACESCQASPWKGPVMERIPRPYPGHSQLPALHYKAVWETSRLNEDGTERKPDDYSPGSNLRRLFDKGDIHLDAPEEIRDFSERYVVSREHV